MKKLLILNLFVLFLSFSFAQENIPDKQFMLGCTHVGTNEDITHYINSPGEVWEWNGSAFVTGGVYSESLVTTGNANFNNADWPGFNFSWLYGEPHWSLGLYKVTNSKRSDKYFYLDARDSAFGGESYLPDFYIYFNDSTGLYYYKNTSNGWTSIQQSSLIPIWQIKGQSPHTSGLQNFWSNVLVIVNKDNHPRLIWGPYPTNSWTINNYKVYRKYGTSSWQLLTTLSSSTYEYEDQSVHLVAPGGEAGTEVKYYITAIYNTNYETSATDTLTVDVQGDEMGKQRNPGTEKPIEFRLEQNYPNPFNPTTTITFSISKNSFITLKVYDVLGNIVGDLLNTQKDAGSYFITFDASVLPSGFYFYTLTANKYSFTRKMLLAK